MANQALVPYDPERAETARKEQKAAELTPAQKRALMRLGQALIVSEVYLKIGTHWSPIEGNAAVQYGLPDIE